MFLLSGQKPPESNNLLPRDRVFANFRYWEFVVYITGKPKVLADLERLALVSFQKPSYFLPPGHESWQKASALGFEMPLLWHFAGK